MLAAVMATGLLLSGCAVGMSAGANVSVTERPPHHDRDHPEGGRDPYQSASMIAAESAVAVSHPR
jgi:hypothetical protein